MTPSRSVSSPQSPAFPRWQGVFVTGLILWIASVIVTAVTSNVALVPTVVLLGSFLVPVTGVIWFVDHDPSPTLSLAFILKAFIVGGVLGVLGASLLESWLLSDGVLIYFGVGLIEELVKLIALYFVARRLPLYTVRDGIVLGATVGFGFGALESSGYALTALIVQQGNHVALSLGSLVVTELLRGLLAPIGHGLWTGIVGGVLFGVAQRTGRLRITGRVIGAYLFVAILHGLYDSMRGIALVLTALLTATQPPGIAGGQQTLPPPTTNQVPTFTIIEIGGIVLISLIGLMYLWREWRSEAPAR